MKKIETWGIRYNYCDCFLEYMNFKHDLMEYKYLGCNNEHKQKLNEKLKERLFNIQPCTFSSHDHNNFTLFLQKSVYHYEYMDNWEKFNKISFLGKNDFYSHLNI